MMTTTEQFKVGQRVYWNDPDEGLCSKWGVITAIYDTDGNGDSVDDPIVTLDDETDTLMSELSVTDESETVLTCVACGRKESVPMTAYENDDLVDRGWINAELCADNHTGSVVPPKADPTSATCRQIHLENEASLCKEVLDTGSVVHTAIPTVVFSVIDNYIAANKRNLAEATTEAQSKTWADKLDTCYQIRDSLKYEVYPETCETSTAKRVFYKKRNLNEPNEDGSFDDLYEIVDSEGFLVAYTRQQSWMLNIVTAVNHHAALVEALKEAKTSLVGHYQRIRQR